MTEGIIKQICKKYISNDALSYEAKNTAYQIEQDLIAEIKKEINRIYTVEFYLERQKILQKLIGEE